MRVELEVKIEGNGSGVCRESFDDAAESIAAGERKVVGVARIYGAGGFGQTGQAAIQAVRRKVGELSTG